MGLKNFRLTASMDDRFIPAAEAFRKISFENIESICVTFAYDDELSTSSLETNYFIDENGFSLVQFDNLCTSALESCDKPPWFSGFSIATKSVTVDPNTGESEIRAHLVVVTNDKFNVRIFKRQIVDQGDSPWEPTTDDVDIEIAEFEPMFKMVRSKIVLSG